MKLLAVIGTKKSGKTTVAEFIIHQLSKEGYRIGAIKHIHHSFTIDAEGKDTWRFSKAGAELVVSVSPDEIATIKKPGNPMTDVNDILETGRREGLDTMIIEGYRDLVGNRKGLPKIVTAKNAKELEALSKDLAPPIIAVSGVIAAKSETLGFSVPVLDLYRRGDVLIELIKERLFMAERQVEVR